MIGSGNPAMGMSEIVMLAFMKMCVNNSAVTPMAMSSPS